MNDSILDKMIHNLLLLGQDTKLVNFKYNWWIIIG